MFDPIMLGLREHGSGCGIFHEQIKEKGFLKVLWVKNRWVEESLSNLEKGKVIFSFHLEGWSFLRSQKTRHGWRID